MILIKIEGNLPEDEIKRIQKISLTYPYGGDIHGITVDKREFTISNQVDKPVGVPKPNTTCEKNVCCANCKHFIDFDIEKGLQSACINDEIRDVTYVDKPDVFGCTFFEQREV